MLFWLGLLSGISRRGLAGPRGIWSGARVARAPFSESTVKPGAWSDTINSDSLRPGELCESIASPELVMRPAYIRHAGQRKRFTGEGKSDCVWQRTVGSYHTPYTD